MNRRSFFRRLSQAVCVAVAAPYMALAPLRPQVPLGLFNGSALINVTWTSWDSTQEENLDVRLEVKPEDIPYDEDLVKAYDERLYEFYGKLSEGSEQSHFLLGPGGKVEELPL